MNRWRPRPFTLYTGPVTGPNADRRPEWAGPAPEPSRPGLPQENASQRLGGPAGNPIARALLIRLRTRWQRRLPVGVRTVCPVCGNCSTTIVWPSDLVGVADEYGCSHGHRWKVGSL